MARRPHTTILSIESGGARRADFGAEPERPLLFATEAAAEGGAIDATIRALLAPRPAAPKVWVLLESAWTQTLELPRGALAGLSTSEVASALAFELEPLSNVAVADSALGWTRVEEREDRVLLWVTQARSALRAQIADALRRHGCGLLGIAHPCGLGAPAAPDRVSLEVWDQATHVSAPGVAAAVLGARAGSRLWEARLRDGIAGARGPSDSGQAPIAWRGKVRAAAIREPLRGLEIEDSGSLSSEEGAADWLRACAESLARGSAAPVVAPPARPARTVSPALASAAATLALLGFLAFDLKQQMDSASELETQATEAKDRSVRAAAARKRSAELARRRDEARKANDLLEAKVSDAERELSAQWNRLPTLARALREARPKGALLLQVAPTTDAGLSASGIAADAASVSRYACDLAPVLAGAGFAIDAPDTQEKSAEGGAKYVEFHLHFRWARIAPGPRGARETASADGEARR